MFWGTPDGDACNISWHKVASKVYILEQLLKINLVKLPQFNQLRKNRGYV